MNIATFFNSCSYGLGYLLLAMTFFRNYPKWKYLLCFVLLFFIPFLVGFGRYYSLPNIIAYIVCFFSPKNIKTVVFQSVKIVCVGVGIILFFYSIFVSILPAYYHSPVFQVFMRCALLIFASIFYLVYRSSMVNQRTQLYRFLLESFLLLFYVLILPQIKGQSERETALLTLAILFILAIMMVCLTKIDQKNLKKQRQQLEKTHCKRLIFQMQQDLGAYQSASLPCALQCELKNISSPLIRLQLQSFLHRIVIKGKKRVSLLVDDFAELDDEVIYPLYLILHEFFYTASLELEKLDIGQMQIVFAFDAKKENMSIDVSTHIPQTNSTFLDFCKKRKYAYSLKHLSRHFPVQNRMYRELRKHPNGATYLYQEITFATCYGRKSA